MQQNDEPIQSFPRNAYAGSGSYLQEVRRRMRAGILIYLEQYSLILRILY